MSKVILVINCGSSTVKYQLIEAISEKTVDGGTVEVSGDQGAAVSEIVERCKDKQIAAVGHRVVHGGTAFRDAALIDDAVIKAIEACSSLAPLHNPNNLAGIRAAREGFPDIPHVAVFDTAFHATLPRRASHYALPPDLADEGMRRFGFHGPSHHYVTLKAAAFLDRDVHSMRIVSLHLGNGASACAVEWGHSTETSMGMTPLEGLVMGTRSGDLDPGIILRLIRERDGDVDAVDHVLNRESGLKGLSGISNDLREIEAAAEKGDDAARLAISVFTHRARKYIGAYAAAMGGLDAVVLTGGIGENSASMRQRILQRLDFLGLTIDDAANSDVRVSHEDPVARISEAHSRVQAFVVKTNEERMIAQQTARLTGMHVQNPGPIPIAVSGRHIHLDEETFAQLFGEGATPTHHADLSQPGQYACKEKVNLIGPRDRIDGVRLLAPLRSKNQVEISRTDEFKLGVDAPVRDSGRTKDSAPITIEGPKGTVHLKEGLICARRHIHMHTDDAERFGVGNKDEVEVAITGGPRDLIFGDVLVRVSPAYKLEMHIDTDEANAAELPRHSDGQLVYADIEGFTAEIRTKKSA